MLPYDLVEEDDGRAVVIVPMPDGYSSSADVDVTYDDARGCVSIHFDTARGTTSKLGSVVLPGYTFGADAGGVFSKSKRRYTFRVVKSPSATPDVAPEASSDQSERVGARRATASPPGSQHADVSGSDDDGAAADDADSPTNASKRKRKKKKKKKSSAGAAAGGDASAAEAAATAAQAEPAAEQQEERGAEAPQPESDECVDARSGDGDASSTGSAATAEAAPATPDTAPAPAGASADAAGGDGGAASPDEPQAVVALKAEVAPSAHVGPFLRYSMAKQVVKGEDKWLQEPHNTWAHAHWDGAAPFAAFAVLDGHGGKHAVHLAARTLLVRLAHHLERSGVHPGRAAAAADGAEDSGEDEDDEACGASDAERRVWAAQEALIEALPQAMVAAFADVDGECRSKYARSGTTATLAVAVGWELVVANVGDTCAYLDTGDQVVRVSANHRLDDNEAERARVLAAGGEVAPATVEGVQAGPRRVWPGGLAMSRSLGDREAGDLVPGLPEVRQVTLPPGGARLAIASDGLWDCVTPKTLMHQLRGVAATVAVERAKVAAIKKKGLRDDITLLMVDFAPSAADRVPPSLEAGGGAPRRGSPEPLAVWRPLEPPGAGSAGAWRARLAARRAGAAALLARLRRMAAAAEAAAAARAPATAAARPGVGGGGGCAPMSDTYRELATLRVDPAVLMASLQEPPSEEEEGAGEQAQTCASCPRPPRLSFEGGHPHSQGTPQQQQQQGGEGGGGYPQQRRGPRGGRWEGGAPVSEVVVH